jgi:Kef-type K+ transport system membrane component KefB/nucleotide-binding universal stress UspA family protein
LKTEKRARAPISTSAGVKAFAAGLVLLAATTTSALAADTPQKGPSELIFVAQIAVLLLVGRLLGEAMLRLKQPAVMGQLIAGLMLGPSLLGALFPDFQHALFPAAKEQKAMLDALSQFGILMLLLLTGMETDLKLVRQTGRAAISASLSGITVPFACGVALGELLPDSMLPDPGKRLITSLFLGTALSIASVKIVATIIREMNFMRRTVGQVILASAIIDDTVGWMITAVIFSLALQGHVDAFSLAKSVLGTVAFMGLSLTIGRRLVFFVIRWVNDTFVSDFAVITAILLIMCAMAITTDLIGVHTVLGAFVAGILIGESPILTRHIDEQLRGLTIAFFMPVFFGTAGLSADLTILKDPHLLLLTLGLIVIASIGKFGGAFAGGKLGGLTFRESLALGTGMNARGSTEVIVATIGLSMGALSQNLFTMIVAMAVITTMAMPPTLRWALARLPMRKEEKQRLEREEMEARGFVPNLERLLLAIDDSENAKFASRVAGLLAGTRGMPTTVLHITDTSKIEAKKTDDKLDPKGSKPKAMTVESKDDAKKSEGNGENDKKDDKAEKITREKEKEGEKQAEKAGEAVKEAAEQTKSRQKKEEKTDAAVDVTTIVHEAPTPEVIAKEAEKGYDLMIIGLEKTATREKEFHESVTALAMGFEGPLAIADARGDLLAKPSDKLSILVPVNGTESSRRGAEVAIAIARATKAFLTVLYVAVGNKRSGRRGSGTRRQEEAILKDIVAIADGYNMSIRTAVVSENAADKAIFGEAKRRKNNLVVMGVGRRPGDKLFFGDTAASLLQDADCSLLFIAT